MSSELMVALVAGLLGGGIFSGLAAFRRARPAGRLDEIRGIREANDELRVERERLSRELAEERRRRKELEEKFRQLESELRQWEQRSADLEKRLDSLFAWIRLNTSFDPADVDPLA